MSQESFLRFLITVRDSPGMRARYSPRNLSQMLFHAKNDGFDFTAPELFEVIGRLEANVILNLDRDPFDGTSRLWSRMWGRRFLDYLVEHVVRRHSDDELQAFIKAQDWGQR